ncbi:hypothetical protein [Candidatus Palauibacter sp.]|uniref:hypothetical protein n=1 Tax=Candidatus Palauibacter sp. TaxID=3101350 RepID=UPI003AF22FB3
MTVDRRGFVIRTGAGAAGLTIGLSGCEPGSGGSARSPVQDNWPTDPDALAAAYRDNIYTRLLGIRPHLPAHEHVSRLGGGRMDPEVIAAMAEANAFFVDMHELMAAAGARIAELVGAEAALVTSGGFSAMVLGAAGCLTGTDSERVHALPLPTWPRRECLIQTPHRFGYDRAYRDAGMTIVEAGTREEFRAQLSERTAMIAALATAERQTMFAPPAPVDWAPAPGPEVMAVREQIEIGREAGVPVLVDMASDLPTGVDLREFVDAGADLIVISGGKGIGGPQSSGILAGRADLIEAARLNASPNDAIGRGMKVGKEEIVGLVVALERYVARDVESWVAGWSEMARHIASQLADVPGLTAEVVTNTAGYEDVELTWDPEIIPLTTDEAKAGLMAGEPRLAYLMTVRTRLLREGEDALVVRSLRDLFARAAATS